MNLNLRRDVPLIFKIGLALAYGPAAIGVVLLPVMVGVLTANGVPGHIVGLLGFLEFGGKAFGAAACALAVKRFGALPICTVGGCMMFTGDFVSAFSATDMSLLFTGRAISGFGGGLAIGSAVAEVARTGLGAKSFGVMLSTAMLLASAGYLIGPNLVNVANGRGVFFVNAGFGAIVLSAAFLLSKYSPPEIVDEMPKTVPGVLVSLKHIRDEYLAIALTAAALFTYTIGELSLITLVIPLGKSYGLSMQQASQIMVVILLVNCVPPLIAGWVERKFGLAFPITFCVTVLIVCNFMLVSRLLALSFVVFLPIRILTQALITVLLLALFAKADPSGRAVAAAKGSQYSGAAVAPLTAVYFVDLGTQDYIYLGVYSSLAFVIALAFALALSWRSPAKRAKAIEQHRDRRPVD